MKIPKIPKLSQEELLDKRIIVIEKYLLDESDFKSLFQSLQFFAKNKTLEPVFIVFKCNGGDSYAGYMMYRSIHLFRKKFGMKIIGVAWGNVDSIATLIFQACTLRYMIYPYSSLFFHLLEGQARKINAETDLAKHFEIEKIEHTALKNAQNKFFHLFTQASGKLTFASIKELFIKNTRTSPLQSIKIGFADRKIKVFDFNNPTSIL